MVGARRLLKPLAEINLSYSFRVRFPRVGSSMVEQRPFKALVVGSSPTHPTLCSLGRFLSESGF
jgi:hypothetical protein